MDKRLERILPRVQKPARYTGGEYNQILKDRDAVDLRLAFCFPDTYEIGMSNLGMSILYQTMNSLPFVWCERVFAPWGDMYAEMKQAGIRGKTLIVNLPGSEKAAKENLLAVIDALVHGMDMLLSEGSTDHNHDHHGHHHHHNEYAE